jgi:hypothetical protein
MARGGLSGSLAMTEFEAALGVTTESLVMDAQPPQLGYFAVLSVEPVLNCLDHYGVMPAEQGMAEGVRWPGAATGIGTGGHWMH